MVPVPPPSVELPSAASVGDTRGWGEREGQVVTVGQASAAPKGSHRVSNPDLGATKPHPNPSLPFSAIAPWDGCNLHDGQHSTAGTKIPCFHLTLLLKSWDLGPPANPSSALDSGGLPVPHCLPAAACFAPLHRKTTSPSKASSLQTYCTATTISNTLREIQYYFVFPLHLKPCPQYFSSQVYSGSRAQEMRKKTPPLQYCKMALGSRAQRKSMLKRV